MPKANRTKSAAFKVRTCPHCGRKTRGPAHFRHERACRLRVRGRTMGARGPGRRAMPDRERGERGARPMGQLFEQLRRLVQQEIQRELGLAR